MEGFTMAIALTEVTGIGESTVKLLVEHGYENAEDLAEATLAGLTVVPGFSEVRAGRVIAAAQQLVAAAKPKAKPKAKAAPKAKSKQKKEKKQKKDKKGDKKKGKKDKKKKKKK